MYAERDQQIAAMIRGEIAKLECERVQLGYERGSQNGIYFQGIEVGLRKALAFIDPDPHS